MDDIKSVISLLCKHLNLLFDINFKSEYFRLAKYNKSNDNVVSMFWVLLSKIIDQPVSKYIARTVKMHFLKNLKYDCIQFYSLPEDMSHGSRELLIALSYLLASDHLNEFVNKAISNCPLNPKFKSDQRHSSTENFTFNLKQFKSDEDYHNAISWMEGRLENNEKISLDYQHHFKKLAQKISLKNFPDIDLSFNEILAVSSDSQHAKQFLEQTENPARIASYHESWLQKQSVYWEWMNSVLLERQKENMSPNVQEIDKLFN